MNIQDILNTYLKPDVSLHGTDINDLIKQVYNQAIDDCIKNVTLTDFAIEFLQEGASDAIEIESLKKLKL